MAINKEIVSESILPVWPRLTDAGLRASWRDYDLLSDTLMIYFGGRSVPAYSDLVECDQVEAMYLRLDIYTNEVVGLQIEYFLAIVVPSRPVLFSLLDGATLRGLTPIELDEIKRLLGIHEAFSPEEGTPEHVLRSLINDIQAGRPPLAQEVRANQTVLDKIFQSDRYR